MRILEQDILISNDSRPWLTGCQMGGGKRSSNFILFHHSENSSVSRWPQKLGRNPRDRYTGLIKRGGD